MVVSGVLCVNKPTGMTSHDVVHRIRRTFKVKAGHAGTLDPLAQGVLIILIGDYTRLSEYFTSDSKKYNTTVKLGVETDTIDSEGCIVSQKSTDHLTEEIIKNSISRFTGKISQIPPMFSAVKVNGKPLYKAARKGETVDRKPRQVNIHSLELVKFSTSEIELDVYCSKGTYIRQLALDICLDSNTVGHLTKLTRTASGDFIIKNAIPLDSILEMSTEEFIDNLDSGIRFLKGFYILENISDDDFSKISNGTQIELPLVQDTENAAVVTKSGYIAAIGQIKNNNFFPGKVLRNIIDNSFYQNTQNQIKGELPK
ncbi:MAG: tRNA pseudouridine(55) synthase TruB [Deltaproteobacteria bacterium]|nr:tRNA pseudouridine(55) synthase TruB [Deltaproteobacteria bacterium]